MDTAEAVEKILSHHGVKGMKWGVRRKATVGPQEVILRDSRFPGSKRLVGKGGGGHPTTEEAARSRVIGQIGKKSGTKALTNQQLEEYNRRLNLEQNFSRLQSTDVGPPRKFVRWLLKTNQGKSAVQAATEHGTEKVSTKFAAVKAARIAAKAAA